MAKLQDMTDALDRIDTATNEVATELTDLKKQLTNAGLPADVEDTVLARLQAAATKLEGVGKPTDESTGNSEDAVEDAVEEGVA